MSVIEHISAQLNRQDAVTQTITLMAIQILHYLFRIGNELRRDFQKNISPTLWVIRQAI